MTHYATIFAEKHGNITKEAFSLQFDKIPKPFAFAAYPIPHKQSKEVKNIISDLLSQEVIYRTTTAYQSPSFFVLKPNKKLRFVINNKHLNKYLKRNLYPMPTIDSLLSKIGRGMLFQPWI